MIIRESFESVLLTWFFKFVVPEIKPFVSYLHKVLGKTISLNNNSFTVWVHQFVVSKKKIVIHFPIGSIVEIFFCSDVHLGFMSDTKIDN